MRAQAHTLEAIVSGMLLLASLVFALQMTAVTPLSASTSSQHIENQQQAIGHGVLASAVAEGALKPAVSTGTTARRSSQHPFENTTRIAPGSASFRGVANESFRLSGESPTTSISGSEHAGALFRPATSTA